MAAELIVVAGGGGFIGAHLAKTFLEQGQRVRVIDKKPLSDWWQRHDQAENQVLDLQDRAVCQQALAGAQVVYNLAADMGRMGFIENNKALSRSNVQHHGKSTLGRESQKSGPRNSGEIFHPLL